MSERPRALPADPPPPAADYRGLLRSAGLDRADALALLIHASGRSRAWLIAHDEDAVDAATQARFATLAAARRAGEPVAYLVGQREFFGRAFAVDRRVLIPRPETELLVEWALAHAPAGARVLDLGTGSGAIAVTLAAERRDLELWAVDLSAEALEVAAANAARHAPGRVRLLRSDWTAALGNEGFGLIVSNPPYIAAGDRHLAEGDLRFEPAGALTDQRDGLSCIRAIVAGLETHLLPGGWVGIEHGYDQSAAVRSLLTQAGLEEVASARDLAGIERISVGRRPG
ncbi:peptide chain release factor N(5)-glutamine methyltransferase [Derxia lacustris]|uniref:peptide chain release factor N(5)-glutamine methyltransferase n=1 Tax=Derxia lacustris TaxID=764842 RepID=UPI000A16F335|nr:peptide chain release factor N(5)-glutamine methyltransferase [Derxia lacustris]